MRLCIVPILLGLAAPLASADIVEQPPVVKIKNGYTGETVRRQVWEVGPRNVAPAKLTIASRYFGWLLIDQDGPKNGVARVGCRIDDSGKVAVLSDCRFSCEDEDISHNSYCGGKVARLIDINSIEWPEFPAIDDKLKRRKVQRWAVATILLDPQNRPQVDLSQGEMVEISAVVDVDAKHIFFDYPARAVRANAGGRLTLLCQIQLDLSSICQMEGFDPPENAHLFGTSAESLSRRLGAREKLPDGTSSVGKRFKFYANFRIS